MDIHHARMVRSSPNQLDRALTQLLDLEVWMDAPATATPEAGSTIQFQYDQGQHTLKIEITHLKENSKRLL